MPIAINGSGTITGISAGGLPDGVITTDDIAAGAVTDAKVNASAAIADSKLSGTTCKAWVNFNGTGTVAIRASYNVSSITDNGTGDYTVNFTSALADANYCPVVSGKEVDSTVGTYGVGKISNQTLANTYSASFFRVNGGAYGTTSASDAVAMHVAIFR